MISTPGLQAAAAIRDHHAQLHDTLRTRVVALIADVREGRDPRAARKDVLEFLDSELLPHAAAEERTLYRAADAGPSALLVEAMRAEHGDIVGRVGGLRNADTPLVAATGASVVLALFESHLRKENELLIPALLARPDVSLADLLAGMHELVG
ncbi:MAG TPA: hemerythrin domain-containing protein [Candidatus Limnocylindrales bacterium]|nr:hemerythrin domain-containing protein [Candidatus Limnocylindrales bacterium]